MNEQEQIKEWIKQTKHYVALLEAKMKEPTQDDDCIIAFGSGSIKYEFSVGTEVRRKLVLTDIAGIDREFTIIIKDEEGIETVKPPKCARCGAIRTDDIDSNICGSCADDLRMEEEGWIGQSNSDTGAD